MNRKPILLVVTVVVVVSAFLGTLASGKRPQLGLDLRGGISVLLFPVKGTDPSLLDTARQIIENRVNALGVAEPEVSRQGNEIEVDLAGVHNRQTALDTIGSTGEMQNREELGTLAVGQAIPDTTTTTTKPATTTTTKPGETTTTKAGATTTAPAATTTTAAPATTTTAAAATTTTKPKAAAAAGATTTTAPGNTTTTTNLVPTGKTCKGLVNESKPPSPTEPGWFWDQVGKTGAHKQCYLLGPNLLPGTAVSAASAIYDPSQGGWGVNVTYKGNQFVEKIAQPYVNKQVAIVLDNAVISDPMINPGITGSDVRISGNFGQSEAHSLALALRYGSLPVKFDQSQETVQDVSPTLGSSQLTAGLAAGVIGLALVAIYMFIFYRVLGMVVWFGLALTGMVLFTMVTWLGDLQGVTLTLAGVTGIIVSVGVTVDSYVVFYERLKDEVRTGKTVRSSIEVGWKRAWRTIVAADAVALIGAGVLYVLTIGSVKGFAYFLALSTIVDLVLAWCYMHPLVSLMSRRASLVGRAGVGVAAGLDVAGRTVV
ncbi:MAG TPA: protein translocase subunit SecD [Acidimicrobiia bacterium]